MSTAEVIATVSGVLAIVISLNTLRVLRAMERRMTEADRRLDKRLS